MVSLILSNKPVNFLAAMNIPPPASPANISPMETFSVIHVNVFFMGSQIFFATFTIQLPTVTRIFPKPFKPSMELPNNLETPETILENTSVRPPVSNFSLSDVKKSPMDATVSRTKFTNFLALISSSELPDIACTTEDTIFLNISNIENNPLNVRFSSGAIS